MINLAIFECFYRILNGFLNLYNVDFFGLGFTWLQFILSVFLIGVALSFVFYGFNVVDKFNFIHLFRSKQVIKIMSNTAREEQISKLGTVASNDYVPSGYIDVWGDGTYVVSSKDY